MYKSQIQDPDMMVKKRVCASGRRHDGITPKLPVKFEEMEISKLDGSEGKFTFTLGQLSQYTNEYEWLFREAKGDYAIIQRMPWKIVVHRSEDEDFVQYLEVCLKCKPKEQKYDQWSCEASVTFKILPQSDGDISKKMRRDSSSTLVDVYQLRHVFYGRHSKYCAVRLAKKEELMDPANGWYDPATDSIRMEVVVKAEMPCGVGLDLQEQFLSSIDCSYKFYESGDFSDCVIQYVDTQDSNNNKDFLVHKLMLASRSDVFAAMFTNKDTKESRESRVEIVDSTARAIQQMLHFMYAGKLPADFQQEDATELLKLADKYGIKHLALVSEEHMIGSLTPENACDRLVIADLHNAHSLWIACGELMRNNLDAVKQQEKWAALEKSSPELVARVHNEFPPRRISNYRYGWAHRM